MYKIGDYGQWKVQMSWKHSTFEEQVSMFLPILSRFLFIFTISYRTVLKLYFAVLLSLTCHIVTELLVFDKFTIPYNPKFCSL